MVSLLCGTACVAGCGGGTVSPVSTSAITYTVTYIGNGATSGTVPVDGNKYAAGATATVLANSGSLVNAGYTFSGWNTTASGAGTAYAAGATFAMGGSNVVLYAQWTLAPTYTVTYNGNGATGASVPFDGNKSTRLGPRRRCWATLAAWSTQALRSPGGTRRPTELGQLTP